LKAIGPNVDGNKGAAIEQLPVRVVSKVGGMMVVVRTVGPFFCSRAGGRDVFQHGFADDGVAKQVRQPGSQRQ